MYLNQDNMTINLDAFPNKKTVIGMALFLVPMIANQLGYSVEPDSIVEMVEQGFLMAGAVLTLYGLVMKAIRTVKSMFTK